MNENLINLVIQAKNLSQNALNQVKGQLGELQNSTQNLASKGFDKLGGAINKTADLMKGLAVGGVVLTTMFAGLGFNNAMKIQDGMADVQKSAGLTTDKVSKLRDQILDLSTTTQTKSFELIGIAKIGGAIGVAENDLLAFTASIDKVSTALGDEFTGGAEEVSNKLGTLRNLFKDTSGIAYSDAMMRIGSSINSLGASGTATGPVVAEFAARIGQLGPALSPTITQTLGLGAAFQEMGLSAEISSGGLSNILITAGQKSEAFAAQIGISTTAFQEMLKNSPNDALLTLAKSFEGIADDPTKLALAMKELGLGSQESIKVMSLLASKTDLVKEKQKLASEEFAKGSSIIDEYNIKNNTMSAILGKAENVFVKFSSSLWNANLGGIGEQLQKLVIIVAQFDMNSAIESAGRFADQIKNTVLDLDLFGRNLENTKLVAFSLAGVIGTILVGALISLAGSIVTATAPFIALGLLFAGLYLAFQNQEIIIKTLQDLWGQFTGKMTEFGGFLANIFKPELEMLNSVWNNFVEIMKTVWNNLQPLIAILYVLATQALQAVFYAFEQLRQPLNDFIKAIFNIARPIMDILAPAFVYIVGMISTLLIPAFQILWAIVVQAFKGILEIITGVINIVSGVLNIFIGLIKGLFTGDFSQAVEGFKQLWEGLKQFLTGIIDLLLATIRGFIDGIWNIFKGADLAKAGAEMMQGFQNSIWAAKDGIMNAVGNISSSITSSFKNAANSAWSAVSNLKVPDFGGGKPINGKGSAVDGKGSAWAKGGAFQNGSVVPFASGGVVNSPTNFGMSGGRTGLMGEAGPEAIMPLTRMSGGKLGVKAEGGGGNITINLNGTFLGTERDRLDLVKMLENALKKQLKLA